jgi:hypothetical protein
VKGYLFEYELLKITRLGARLRYTERIYLPGADDFESFKEGEETQTLIWQVKELDALHDLWQGAQARCNARLYLERERLKKVQNSSSVNQEDPINLSFPDIEEYFTKYGKGSHMLEYDFDPDTPEPVPYKKADGKMSIFQCWTHKHTKYSVKRYAAPNGKSVDSGRLSKYLKKIKQSLFPLAHARAKKIIELNEGGFIQSNEVDEIEVTLDRREILEQQVSFDCVKSFVPFQ